MATKKDPEKQARLAKNRIIIDNWFEKKVFEIPYESFLRIKFSLVHDGEPLSGGETFIRDLARSYRNVYGKWPVIFRA